MSPKSNDATPPLPRLLWFACLLTAFATFVHPTAASTSSSVSKRSPALPAERAALAPFVLPPKPSTCDRRPATFRPGRLRLLYDITPQEGFNLRRDVYVRMAVFARHMQKSGAIGWHDVRLVVPPFRQMPHWQNADDNNDELMRPHYWTKFFDLQQIAAYAPVLDAWEYYAEQQRRPTPVHFVQLINYPVDDGPFSDRYELTKRLCKATPPIFGECNITVAEYWNARFQGNVVGLGRLVEELWRRRDASAESADLHVYLWRADIALHMRYGEAEYWRARRSMRFAGYLEREATDYRRTGMGLPVLEGEVQRPWRWQDEMPFRGARGAPYACIHLRRGDFLTSSRIDSTPTLRQAADQTRLAVQLYNSQEEGYVIRDVFVATDATGLEFDDLKKLLGRLRAHRYRASERPFAFGPGADAIVEQIVCSRAALFIGTYDSTFTFRIQEEREILGMRPDRTFETFCGRKAMQLGGGHMCRNNSVWKIRWYTDPDEDEDDVDPPCKCDCKI